MQERLSMKIEEEIERIIRIYAPHTEIALTDLEKSKDQILQLFRDEVVGMEKSIKSNDPYLFEQSYNQAIDDMLKKLEDNPKD